MLHDAEIIEAVAEMRMAGILDAAGLIGGPDQTGTARCFADGRTHSYRIWDGGPDGGQRIAVTNPDIRAIQMAKAALYSGARQPARLLTSAKLWESAASMPGSSGS